MSLTGESTETERRLEAVRGCGRWGRDQEGLLRATEFLYGMKENALKLDSGDGQQLCDLLKRHFFSFFLNKDFVYLFLDRGEGKEKERKRHSTVWLPLACPLIGLWGPDPQPRHVP